MNDLTTTELAESPNKFGRRLTGTLTVIAVMLVCLIAGLAIYFWYSGIHVVVTNDAAVVAQDVVIRVTGETINLGDLPAGASRRRNLRPNGSSNVTIEFTNSGGDRHVWDFDYRFEPDEQIEFEFRLHDNGVSASDSRTAK